LIEAADPRWNLALRGGEEIRVPEAGRIFISGNVKRPGAFLLSDLTNATVLKAVAFSEGLLPYSAKQAFIYRPDGKGVRTEIALNLRDILDRKAPDVELQPEDLLYIPDNRNRKMTAAILEKLIGFGGGATTAIIYAGVR
jgi:polysaccharide export outer membrane protein